MLEFKKMGVVVTLWWEYFMMSTMLYDESSFMMRIHSKVKWLSITKVLNTVLIYLINFDKSWWISIKNNRLK